MRNLRWACRAKSDHFELDLTEVSRGKAYFFYTDVRSGKVDR